MQITPIFDNFIWGNQVKKTTVEYLLSLNWTQFHQLGDDALMKKWWTPNNMLLEMKQAGEKCHKLNTMRQCIKELENEVVKQQRRKIANFQIFD